MHSDAKALVEMGNRLFSAKSHIDLRNQEIAEHFYPERADFTVRREFEKDWAGHLMTGYPSNVRRKLGDAIGSMLRPRGRQWFHIGLDDDEKESELDGRAWMDWAEGVMRRAMYDRITQFTVATKQGDHDFAAFGSPIISVEVNRRDTALLYRCWHPRDVAWQDDFTGENESIHRNWDVRCDQLVRLFPGKCHENVVTRAEREPGKTVKVRHVMIRTDAYDGDALQDWTSLYIDCENQHILEEVGSITRKYVIPRWATVSGSQYAFSPATLIALPDARLLQAMTLTLLEAGEMSTRPPMLGVSEAIRSDMQLYPGGFTAIDAEYDERLGEVLRPLVQDKSGIPFGLEMADRVMGQIGEALYMNTLSLPPTGGPDMTAYEVGQRVQEYIRNAMPLFEPMEYEYNGQLCEMTFETLMAEGAFGSPMDIPASIQGRDIRFRFESPLSDQVEREKGQAFLEARQMIEAAGGLDPSAVQAVDFGVALRDVLQGIGTPADWLRSPEQVAEIQRAQVEQEAMAQAMAQARDGAAAAESLGRAAQGFSALG